VQVTSAAFQNGLLKIDLVREVPEAMKPRRIEITHNDNQRIEQKKAA
jgi:molecular chaperone IbpA